MKRFLLSLVFFVLVAACGRRDKVFVPSRLLTEQEMVEIMFDMQIIEAELTQQKPHAKDASATIQNHNRIAAEYYSQLFEHHGITDSIFAENIRYYTERPVVLEHIMDSVVMRLTSAAP